MPEDVLTRPIHDQGVIEFRYHGEICLVEPYRLGTDGNSSSELEVLIETVGGFSLNNDDVSL